MHNEHQQIASESEYCVYVPGTLARRLYLYPLSAGYFYYSAGYRLFRRSFDSFLIMYIARGSCDGYVGSSSFHAEAGDFVLLDCYRPHSYGSTESWEASWLHFDGVLAREYFEEIHSRSGMIVHPSEPDDCIRLLGEIRRAFRAGNPVSEAALSRDITDLLNRLLVPATGNRDVSAPTDAISSTVAYINRHYQEPLSLHDMAEAAGFSPYHFIRIFAEATGFTPHQYVLNTRIAAARFLLHSTDLPVKDIAFRTGFVSESSFCTAFKKWEGVTPSQYRQRT